MANPEAVQQALQRQFVGDLHGAARIYETMLDEDPADAKALQYLGLNLSQGEDPERGVEMLREAVLIGDDPVAHLVLAQAQFIAGQIQASIASFNRCLIRDPFLAAAYSGLGRAQRAAGDFVEAETALRRALVLEAQNPATHLELSALLRDMGRPVDAAVAADAAILLAPGDATAWMALGNALLEANEPTAAVAVQNRAAELAPDSDLVQYNLGNALRGAGQEAAAEAAYRAAIRLRPNFPEAFCGLSGVEYLQERFAEAEASARQAIDLRGDYGDAFLALGNAVQAQFRYAEAEAHYRRVLACAGTSTRIAVAAWSNLCTSLTAQERLVEAVAAADSALALRPDFANAAYNRAITLLTAGDYAAGWPAFESRWNISWSPPRDFVQPQWAGENLEGRHILLHAEQGLGDTLQFFRYLPMVAARAGRVTLEVQPGMGRLLRSQPGMAAIAVVEGGADLPDFDLHCPLMSLPGAFQTNLDNIPPAPYLVADPQLVVAWQPRLKSGQPEALRIGLAWAGAARIGYVNSERSIPLASLAPLAAAAPDAVFYSLQLEATEAELSGCGFSLLNPMAEVTDFADTAAVVAQLDLVITVDTSVAHLAGAMGKPVWLLSRYNGCWRWMNKRADSPWYSTVHIYRQSRPRHWAPTIAVVAAELAGLVAVRAGGSGGG